MHPTDDVILIYPSGPSPRVHFEQFKQRQETASLATWAYGNFTQQRHCQIHFRSTSVVFFSNSCYPGSSCPPGIIMLFSDKSMGALTADQDLLMAVTLYCSLVFFLVLVWLNIFQYFFYKIFPSSLPTLPPCWRWTQSLVCVLANTTTELYSGLVFLIFNLSCLSFFPPFWFW